MKTESIVDSNVEKLKELFPNCVVEDLDENGQGTKRVDFDLLKQELSKELIDENKERYQMTWPNKKQAVLKANTEIAKTLRPCREESEDYENTENIYIKGDNLDVLKVLRQTYMNKVKMIYIDPPYNTGNDFIYKDNYSKDREEYLEESGQVDEDGNRMFKNSESNGRFHTDWLNMIYPRLRVAKDLLTDDGVIFISIDDNEQANLKKVCDEIFGESNFINNFMWLHGKGKKDNWSRTLQQYILCYCKNKDYLPPWKDSRTTNYEFSNPDNDQKGKWFSGSLSFSESRSNPLHENYYTITSPSGINWTRQWQISQVEMNELISNGDIFWGYYPNYDSVPRQKIRPSVIEVIPANILENCGTTKSAINDLRQLLESDVFEYPKTVNLLKKVLQLNTQDSDIILDFFSGSATTAHAVMQLNAEDGGKRKYIMVQYPENLDDSLKNATSDSRNIIENAIKLCNKLNKPHYLTEIGKERIRRAGKKIKEENANATNLDIGFRVFKLDSSNMKDCYYYPEDTTQDMLEKLQDNIKEDRTAEDLLIQVMLELEIELSSKIETVEIEGKKVYKVNEQELVCCFERNLTNEIVTEIAKMQPKYVVFRDSSMQSDSVNINFEQLFKSYAPNTIRKVL